MSGPIRRYARLAAASTAFATPVSTSLLAQDAQTLPLVSPQQTSQRSPSGSTALPPIVIQGAVNPDGSTVASGGLDVPTPSFGPFGAVPARDIPFSTNSIPQAIIRDQQNHSVDEALKNDSSIRAFPTTVGFAQNVQIRGISSNAAAGFQDGLNLLTIGQPAIEIDERIDILKGPASIFYGFAPPAGVINFVSKLPADQAFTDLGAGFISRASGDEHLDVNRRFGQDNAFGARASVYQQNGDVPVSRTAARRAAQSLALDWKTNELHVWSNFQHYEFKQYGGNPALFFAPLTTSYLPKPPNPFGLFGQPFFNQMGETILTDGGFEWARNGWAINGAAGYSDNRYTSVGQLFPTGTTVSSDGTTPVTSFPALQHVESSAARLAVSKEAAFGALRNKLTLALTYSQQNLSLGQTGGVVSGISNIYAPIYFPTPYLPNAKTTNIATLQTTQTLLDDLDLGRFVTVSGGAIRSDYKAVTSALPAGNELSSLHQTAVTPVAALAFHPRDNLMAYGSFIQSLQAGQIAPTTAANANEVLPPFVGQQGEVGIKWTVSPAFRVDAALFQIQQASTFLNAQNVLTEQGLQINRGGEIELAGRLTPDLKVFGGATFIDPRVYNNATFYDGKGPGISKVRVSMFVEYEPVFLRGITLIGGVYYNSRFLVQENSRQLVEAGFAQDVYAAGTITEDLGFKYHTRLDGVPVVFRAYATNVTNQSLWYVANPANNGQVILGQPRTVKLDATIRF